MTRTARTSPSDNELARQLDIQRIRVNSDGYDASGAYWGAGHDVFIATTTDGAEEVTVRARNVTDARQKVAAEFARQPGEARETHEDIGGNSPHASRYEIDWLNPVTNETVRIRITHQRERFLIGGDHLEIESIKPKKAPLPITETGYRSHFMPALDLINAGGPVTFVTAWINQEAKGAAWRKAASAKLATATKPVAQGDLFQWAETHSEVSTKQPSRPKKSAARPARKPTRDTDPE